MPHEDSTWEYIFFANDSLKSRHAVRAVIDHAHLDNAFPDISVPYMKVSEDGRSRSGVDHKGGLQMSSREFV